MNVSEVIYGEGDDVRSPAFDQADKILPRFALQIDQTNCVTGTALCCCDKFEAERLEPKINLRIHQTAGMNGQQFHLFRKGLNLADLSLEQALSEFLRVILARRGYSKAVARVGNAGCGRL